MNTRDGGMDLCRDDKRGSGTGLLNGYRTSWKRESEIEKVVT